MRVAAEIAGGDAGFDDGVDGVVGVELEARAAVGVHVREDADDGCFAVVDGDDAIFICGHRDGADLIDAEGYVQLFVVDRFVGLGVDDFDVEGRGLSGSDDGSEGGQKKNRSVSTARLFGCLKYRVQSDLSNVAN